MDPNEALRVIRQLKEEVQDGTRSSDVEQLCATVDELCEQLTALDEWLSRGGFRPRDWVHS